MNGLDDMPALVATDANNNNRNNYFTKETFSDSASSGAENDYEDVDQDEADFVSRKVKGLFSDTIFDNVKEMFTYESEKTGFNLIDVLTKYNMDMFAYIRMINYIRKEAPQPSVFSVDYESESEQPWNADKYMNTVIEDDAALQFDVEEDLDTLELKCDVNNVARMEENDLVRGYRNRLAESEAKVEQLTDVVAKLRNLATGLLTKTPSGMPVRDRSDSESSKKSSGSEDDDSHYIASYANYNIHLEMLQVDVFFIQIGCSFFNVLF